VIVAAWAILAIFLLACSIVTFSLPWTQDTLEEWIDRYTDPDRGHDCDVDGWADELRRDARG
jgi:hypothetical protein